MNTFRARDAYVTIDRYIDEKRLSPAMRAWAKPIAQWDKQARSASNVKASGRKPWADIFDDDMDLVGCGGDACDAETTRDNSGHADEADDAPTQPQPTRWTQPARSPTRTPFNLGDAAIVSTQARPEKHRMTDSSGTETSQPPKLKRLFGESSRGPRTLREALPYGPARQKAHDEEKEAMRAALAAKDAQILELQAGMMNLQRTIESMMNAMANSGLISMQAAAATLAEAAPVAPQQQVDQNTMEAVSQDASMWHNTDAENATGEL